MGQWWSFQTFMDPSNMPVAYEPPTFDPNYGLKVKRKERVMIATEQELRAAKIPKELWDFCAHTLLEVHRCKADNFPFNYRCRQEVAEASECQRQDYIMRIKEYERERRLIQRQKRRKEKQQKEAGEAMAA